MPLQQSRDSRSWELWNDGKTPPDLLLIPVAAIEIHHKTWLHHQPFKELKKILSKSPLLRQTPQILHFGFSQELSRLQNPSSWEQGQTPQHSQASPHWIIPAWNFTGQMWEWDQSLPGKPGSLP